MKKLPGQPYFRVYFDGINIEIPIFIVSTESDKELFTDFFNRFFNTSRYLIHRKLFMKDPFIGTDKFGQKKYSDRAIESLKFISQKESERFNTITKIRIDTLERWYEKGKEISRPPEVGSDVHYGQSQKTIDKFIEYFKIDPWSFRFPSEKLYGGYNF
ncbi:MAG: hypothetical protein WCK92_08025 [Bacteroidota bacterium]